MDKNEILVDLTIRAFKAALTFFLIVPIVILVWTIWLLAPVDAQAFEKPAEIKISAALDPGMAHFLDLVDPDKNASFDPRLIAPVLDFVESPKDHTALYYANKIGDLTSAYYDFDINRKLISIVQYAFNPKIPPIATMPSSVRLIHWMDGRLNKQPSPDVAHYLDRLDNPVVIEGLLGIQITPDLNSGAYYSYNVYQTLLLFKHRRRNVLVTVSKQMDVSTVGKKGYILGDDNGWDYYYSGKTGLTIPALGWVRSYMYDSSAVNIYFEIDPGVPVVRCAMFKWLKAGWSGINMVQKKHIYRGLKRFAVPFKTIMEYRQLPSPEVMADDFSRVRGLSEDALRSKMTLFSDMMEKRYGPGQPRNRKWPPDLLKNKNPWIDMTPEEMESTLVIEYMKYALGKTRAVEVRELLGLTR